MAFTAFKDHKTLAFTALKIVKLTRELVNLHKAYLPNSFNHCPVSYFGPFLREAVNIVGSSYTTID
jgi:hypothetical protein